MAKQTGLGDNLYVAGYNLSGDTQSLDTVEGGTDPIEVTGIDKSAKERIGGQRDGAIEWMAFFNRAPGRAHPVLGALPRADVAVTYCRGTSLGAPAASMIAKQLNYDGKRSDSGEFTLKVSAAANAYGLEWGQLLTPGARTDTTPTLGAALDTLAAANYGAQAYLHVLAVTGTSVTVAVQDSADGVTWAAVTGLTFTAATGPGSQRIATANTATIRRYVRAVTTGTFTQAQIAVNLVKNETAGIVF